MAAVDKHQQLHARRATLFEEPIQRGADRAAGIKHVVHQDDVLAFYVELDVGGVEDGLDIHRAQVVAVEIDVENADRDFAILKSLNLGGQSLRQRNSAA